MKRILLILTIFVNLYAIENIVNKKKYVANIVPKKMSVKTKKHRFYYLLVPAIYRINNELVFKYNSAKYDMYNKTNKKKITYLKELYKVNTDDELLKALKPHPMSITLAQASMESAWATSRFFVEANNVFGMWSSKRTEKRISARVKRAGNRTIWLRKFDTIDDSIRAYYFLLATGRAFKDFRDLKMKTKDPYELVKKLDKYSEIGAKYGRELSHIIKYNKLQRYDIK